MKSSMGEPVEVRGQLEFHLRGRDTRAGPLQTVTLKATVGEAKLFIPKALEVGREAGNSDSVVELLLMD